MSEFDIPDRTGMILAGRYRVLELLGSGAMGSVWIIEQLALKARMVVKFREELILGAEGKEAAARFLRESRTMSSVRQQNVIELYEVGTAETGEPYIIMELLEGQTLADRLGGGQILAIEDAMSIAMQVARGLEAVHAAGLVHRDVKPDNIFLADVAGELVPKLLDFGLARGVGMTGITRDGSAVGTPGYMAPEQVRGVRDLDARVDVYSLAVNLYEMLTAKLPVEGESVTEVLVNTALEGPVPVWDRRPELAGPFGVALMVALRVDRDQRYASVREMRTKLTHAMESLPDEPEVPVGSVTAPVGAAPGRSEVRAMVGAADLSEAEIATVGTKQTIPDWRPLKPSARVGGPPPIPRAAQRPLKKKSQKPS